MDPNDHITTYKQIRYPQYTILPHTGFIQNREDNKFFTLIALSPG